jgi:hypothetical protein
MNARPTLPRLRWPDGPWKGLSLGRGEAAWRASSLTPFRLFQGTTRGTGEWHVITAIFDTRKSELFVDGAREAAGKNVGNNRLDGLSIGCDHSGVFFLMGSVAEVRFNFPAVGPIPTAPLFPCSTHTSPLSSSRGHSRR